MPEVIGHEPEYIGNGKVWQTRSQSRPNITHLTIKSSEDGSWFCYCEGYRYNQHCWHVDMIKESEGEESDKDEFQVNM